MLEQVLARRALHRIFDQAASHKVAELLRQVSETLINFGCRHPCGHLVEREEVVGYKTLL